MRKRNSALSSTLSGSSSRRSTVRDKLLCVLRMANHCQARPAENNFIVRKMQPRSRFNGAPVRKFSNSAWIASRKGVLLHVAISLWRRIFLKNNVHFKLCLTLQMIRKTSDLVSSGPAGRHHAVQRFTEYTLNPMRATRTPSFRTTGTYNENSFHG